jgi:DNA-binding protein HU-beta
MTRRELVERVREGLSAELSDRQVAEVIERALGEIGAAIQREGRVTLPGFGTFTVRRSAARLGRNPRTGEAIDLPAAATVAFKPAAELRAGLPEPE